MTGKALFITATGTDVGKTVVSLSLCAWARKRNIRTAYYKPIQCGTDGDSIHVLPNGDAKWLSEKLPFEQDVFQTCIYSNPVSPHLAAEKEGRAVSVSSIKDALEKLRSEYALVIVEGAGGVAVPIHRSGADMAELASKLSLPVLLVAQAGLGTLNHTILSWEYLRQKGGRLTGFCFNRGSEERSELEQDNWRTITQRTGMDYWGTTPYVSVLEELGGNKNWDSQLISESLDPYMSEWFYQNSEMV